MKGLGSGDFFFFRPSSGKKIAIGKISSDLNVISPFEKIVFIVLSKLSLNSKNYIETKCFVKTNIKFMLNIYLHYQKNKEKKEDMTR